MSGFTYNSPENMLSVARKSNNFYQIQECVKTIREAVSVGKTSFEVLSTSDEELTQLLRDRLMKDAAPHIAAGNLKVAGNILRQGGYTLQDAGVTEEEYQTYLVQVASNQLERVRHPQIQRDNSINSGHGLLPSFLLEFLREALEEAKVSLA